MALVRGSVREPQKGGQFRSVDLSAYSSSDFPRGRSRLIEVIWMMVQWLLVSSALPGSAHRRHVLRLFGAEIGDRVVIKPRVRIKFPWRLSVGKNSWIGEGVWIDNLAEVRIGDDCCVSQDAYLCTGNHDWGLYTFDLRAAPVTIGSYAWVGARTTIGPGVHIGEGAVLTLGSSAYNATAPWTINAGTPAQQIGFRRLKKGTNYGS